jgi:hypothetical protein
MKKEKSTRNFLSIFFFRWNRGDQHAWVNVDELNNILDEWCNKTSFEIDDTFTSLCNSLKRKDEKKIKY